MAAINYPPAGEDCYSAAAAQCIFDADMMTGRFRQFAAYNRWANARLYAAALALPEEAYRRPTGVFFGSLHGTLNHLLLTDRLWLKRLTGSL